MGKLFVSNSEGVFTEANDKDVLDAAHFAARRKLKKGLEFKGVKTAKALLPPLLAGKDYEVFCVAFLDAHNRLISFDEMFRGTITQTPVYTREVIKRAVDLNAVNLIMVHNHPTGEAEASNPDIMMTIKMKMAAALFEMRVLDHFIVAGDDIKSMEDSGVLSDDAIKKMMFEDMAERFGPDTTIEIDKEGLKEFADALKKASQGNGSSFMEFLRKKMS
jgi:DNA repair protein RadC